MTNTTNYNLLLAEGTDLVNYLTQTNPNFTSLDTIIKGVSDATVTTATEVTVGTAHAIARTLPNANVIRFVATSNWVTGDIMTVDGVTVSALKTDGTTLKSGDYIIGATVIGVLDGTRFTVFISTTSASAANEISYDNTSSGLSATNVQDAVDEVQANTLADIVIDTAVSTTVTVAGNSVAPVVAYAAKPGYNIVGVIGISAFSSWISYGEYGRLDASNVRAYAINNDSNAATGTITFTVLYKKQ